MARKRFSTKFSDSATEWRTDRLRTWLVPTKLDFHILFGVKPILNMYLGTTGLLLHVLDVFLELFLQGFGLERVNEH
jgi:hypothetical protein